MFPFLLHLNPCLILVLVSHRNINETAREDEKPAQCARKLEVMRFDRQRRGTGSGRVGRPAWPRTGDSDQQRLEQDQRPPKATNMTLWNLQKRIGPPG